MTEAPAIASAAMGPQAPKPAFVIHALTHAVAALTAAADVDRAIILLSAAEAGRIAGPGWFGALVTAARIAVPAVQSTGVLDCGDDSGAVQSAIQAGIETMVFTGRDDVANCLADIARQRGVQILTRRPPALLDLERWFFADADTLYQRCASALDKAEQVGAPAARP